MGRSCGFQTLDHMPKARLNKKTERMPARLLRLRDLSVQDFYETFS